MEETSSALVHQLLVTALMIDPLALREDLQHTASNMSYR